MKNKKNIGGLILSCILLVSLAGCDELIDKILPKQPAPKTPASVTQQAQPDKDASLGANVLARVGSWEATTEDFNRRIEILSGCFP